MWPRRRSPPAFPIIRDQESRIIAAFKDYGPPHLCEGCAWRWIPCKPFNSSVGNFLQAHLRRDDASWSFVPQQTRFPNEQKTNKATNILRDMLVKYETDYFTILSVWWCTKYFSINSVTVLLSSSIRCLTHKTTFAPRNRRSDIKLRLAAAEFTTEGSSQNDAQWWKFCHGR